MDLAEIFKLGQASNVSAAEIKDHIISADERNERAAEIKEKKVEKGRQ